MVAHVGTHCRNGGFPRPELELPSTYLWAPVVATALQNLFPQKANALFGQFHKGNSFWCSHQGITWCLE